MIDVSGSMKLNDPNNLRGSAVDLLVQLLPEESKAGVWTFGRWVNMLVKHRKVDSAWRSDALANSDQINSAGLFTNIGEALEKATYDLPSKDKKYRSSIVLLTDGMVDIDKDPEKNKREWRRIVDEILPRLQSAGVSLHTIALSEKADTDLLNKLSIGTDGIAAVAKNADELMKVFFKAFEAAAPMEQLPLSEEGFVVDSSVEEFTALIFRQDSQEQTRLIGPDQQAYTAQSASKYLKWHRDNKYDLITMKQPLEGRWQVMAKMDPESRITVVSNLNLRVKPLPNNVMKGHKERLSFLLEEDGKTILSPEFLSLMSITASIKTGADELDLQEIWREPVKTVPSPPKGVFTLALPEFSPEGVYQLSLILDGKSFVRQFNHRFTARQPFSADIKAVLNEGKTEYLLTARAFSKEITVGKTQVVATIIAPDDLRKIRPMPPTDSDVWQSTIRPELQGVYTLGVRVRGKYKDGTTFDIELERLQFNYPVEGGLAEEEKPFIAQATPAPTTATDSEAEVKSASASQSEQGVDSNDIAQEPPLPSWVLYVALGVGNVLLLAIGFFAYKKIMGGGAKEDVVDQHSKENIQQEAQAAAPVAEEASEALTNEDEKELIMEDIDPSSSDEPPPKLSEEDNSSLAETTELKGDTLVEPETTASTVDEVAEKEPAESQAKMELKDEEPQVSAIVEQEREAFEELDDIDKETTDAEVEPDETDPTLSPSDKVEKAEAEAEAEDIVSAMLKAQGLDLAEDELDEAISSLMDELENDSAIDDGDSDESDEKS